MSTQLETSDPVMAKMVRTIVEEVDPAMIILFGSRARGEAGADSDVDLLVVEDDAIVAGKSRRLEAARLYRRLADSGVPKDILVVSGAEVERWRYSLNHVIATALQEGKISYGKRTRHRSCRYLCKAEDTAGTCYWTT